MKEKDNQLELARSKLNAVQAQTYTSEGTLTSLEEALADRDKQGRARTGFHSFSQSLVMFASGGDHSVFDPEMELISTMHLHCFHGSYPPNLKFKVKPIKPR